MTLRRLSTRTAGFDAELAALTRYEPGGDAAIRHTVQHILADVRGRGDAALIEYSRRFDASEARSAAELEVPREKAEQALAGTNAVVFRLGTIYGVSDAYSRIRMDLVLNLLTVKAIQHRKISVFGGDQYRPLLHVRDVGEAVVPVLGSDVRGTFNLESENVTIRALAERIAALHPDVQTEFTDLPLQDLRNYRVSSEKARAAFGFDPRLMVEDGVRQIGRLVAEGRVRDPSSPRYSNLDFLRPLLVPERSPLGREVIVPHRFRTGRSAAYAS